MPAIAPVAAVEVEDGIEPLHFALFQDSSQVEAAVVLEEGVVFLGHGRRIQGQPGIRAAGAAA
jgi:hypothetical protein